jgi:8-oxo-dGTP pyrophosphatase MutT (NUDIX family)
MCLLWHADLGTEGMKACIDPYRDLTEADIARRLNEKSTPGYNPEMQATAHKLHNHFRRAAVLIPLIQIDNCWSVVLIRRTETVQDHKGQVAFPGGGWEPADASLEDTALRETYEEIGVSPGDVRILGRSNELATISDYLVTPVVGTMPWPYPLKLSADEVDRVFTIPLAWLANTANHEERPRHFNDSEYQVVYFDLYDGELLWGVSGSIMVELLRLLKI